MKKLMKLLALTLAAVMLLPSAALAAEQTEPKALWMQWLNWEEDPEPDSDVHRNSPLNAIPPEEYHIAFYTSENDGGKLTPVPVDKLEASEGVSIQPLCPGVKGKEHYAVVSVADWNKEYKISYEGYAMELDSRLPELGLYSEPKASTGSYLNTWGYSPVGENSPAYLICTSTDETHGRHLVEASLSKDEPDSENFKLEKVGDNVYKVTMTGSVDADMRRLRVDVTWQNVRFMGGDTYTEGWGSDAWEEASLLVSEKPVKFDSENPEIYYDVKDNFTNKLTLKAGESKDVYLSFTFFNDGAWIMRKTNALAAITSSSDLKFSVDSSDRTKATVSCDVPGTYTFTIYDQSYPVIDAIYHENGEKYTAAEFQKWEEDISYSQNLGKLIIITDLDEWRATGGGTASFEEAFPGQKVEYHIVKKDPWRPVTVTVESDKLPFTDVKAREWYEAAVRFVNSKGYMTGDTATLFNPEGKITGAEFAQILYNKEGKPAAAEGASFQGVAGQWYAPAVLWAAGKGIITDTGDAAIDPEKPLTRQQIALMLYNAMGKPEGTADLSGFTDADQISSWARDAMEWAVSAKVFKGSDGKLTPADTAIRAEVAQILLNYFG